MTTVLTDELLLCVFGWLTHTAASPALSAPLTDGGHGAPSTAVAAVLPLLRVNRRWRRVALDAVLWHAPAMRVVGLRTALLIANAASSLGVASLRLTVTLHAEKETQERTARLLFDASHVGFMTAPVARHTAALQLSGFLGAHDATPRMTALLACFVAGADPSEGPRALALDDCRIEASLVHEVLALMPRLRDLRVSESEHAAATAASAGATSALSHLADAQHAPMETDDGGHPPSTSFTSLHHTPHELLPVAAIDALFQLPQLESLTLEPHDVVSLDGVGWTASPLRSFRTNLLTTARHAFFSAHHFPRLERLVVGLDNATDEASLFGDSPPPKLSHVTLELHGDFPRFALNLTYPSLRVLTIEDYREGKRAVNIAAVRMPSLVRIVYTSDQFLARFATASEGGAATSTTNTNTASASASASTAAGLVTGENVPSSTSLAQRRGAGGFSPPLPFVTLTPAPGGNNSSIGSPSTGGLSSAAAALISSPIHHPITPAAFAPPDPVDALAAWCLPTFRAAPSLREMIIDSHPSQAGVATSGINTSGVSSDGTTTSSSEAQRVPAIIGSHDDSFDGAGGGGGNNVARVADLQHWSAGDVTLAIESMGPGHMQSYRLTRE